MMFEVQKQIKRKKILVIGDVMLDEYYIGTIKRISPEAPVPVFLEEDKKYSLGGAANVAVNMAVNNMDVSVLAIIGADDKGRKLKELFKENGIKSDMLLECVRPTSTKCRLLAGNNQQVIRIDTEDSTDIEEETEKRLFSLVESCISDFQIVVLSDYLKGVLSYNFTRELINLCNSRDIKTLVDVKDSRAEKYKGAYLLKPNKKELGMMSDLSISTEKELLNAARQLRKNCDSEYVLTTCGAEGMVLVDAYDGYQKLSTTSHEVFDVTGAGDTVIAYLAMCIANDIDIFESVRISNIAAGIQVSKVGTSTVMLEEVDWFKKNSRKSETKNKLIKPSDLHIIREKCKNKKIVFTNGCFDILHIGHARYLKEASELGDILIIGLNSDDSVRRLKGENRPINTESERSEFLSYFNFVDYIVIFEDDTPYNLIKDCKPNVLVKGGDYDESNVAGASFVKKIGGEVVIIPLVEGKSTTGIINKLIGI